MEVTLDNSRLDELGKASFSLPTFSHTFPDVSRLNHLNPYKLKHT